MKTIIKFTFLVCYISRLVIATIELDQKHQSMYPYCGKLFGYEWHDASSRVVNSRESDIQYPWVVLLRRFSKIISKTNKKGDPTIAFCGGTVITDK